MNGGVFEIGKSQSVTAVDVNITMGSAGVKKVEVFDDDTSLGLLTTVI